MNTELRNPLAVVARYAPYAADPERKTSTSVVRPAIHPRADGAVFTMRTRRSVSSVRMTQSTA